MECAILPLLNANVLSTGNHPRWTMNAHPQVPTNLVVEDFLWYDNDHVYFPNVRNKAILVALCLSKE